VTDIRATLPAIDTLIVNLQEAEIILGTTLQKEKSVTTIIHKLLKLGPDEVVITDAAAGAYAGNIDDVYHLASFPIKVVSKTGAGDAFSAGYLAAKIHGHSPAVALQWGIGASSSVIQQIGAQAGLPDAKALQAIIKKYGAITPKKIN
jgi:sugar/nucleoside kinase (ribokinase family)